LIASGKLRAIAVTSALPSPAFVGVPTVNASIPGYAVESWYGLYAPAGTPESVIARLNTAVAEAVKHPDFLKKIEHEGLSIVGGPPSSLQTYVQGEQARWKKSSQKTRLNCNKFSEEIMEYKLIQMNVESAIATITFNRPEKR